MANLLSFDKTIFDAVNESEAAVEQKLNCDLLYYYGDIRSARLSFFRNYVESLVAAEGKHAALALCLTTTGGEVEPVEKMVEIIRHHYESVYFVVPSTALSAGTIFCMSGDRIYMDYSSSLGPIDPQVLDKEGKYLVPALGYLDKVEELVKKSQNNTIAPGELAILIRQDLAMLRYYEQARELSQALLRAWLPKYKFKDWAVHRTTNPGTPVTPEQKEERANEIAVLLSNNKEWYSHGRMIGMERVRRILRLEIDDLGQDKGLLDNVRLYSDTLSEYLGRHGHEFLIYNRKVGV